MKTRVEQGWSGKGICDSYSIEDIERSDGSEQKPVGIDLERI